MGDACKKMIRSCILLSPEYESFKQQLSVNAASNLPTTPKDEEKMASSVMSRIPTKMYMETKFIWVARKCWG